MTCRRLGILLAISTLSLAACGPENGPARDVDAGLPEDVDGDGYSAPTDCDDGESSVHPGADEVPYNGVDDDCDPATPDDDLDDDGAPLATDCDDADERISPLLLETPYNGVDDDCDPSTPDDDLDEDGALAATDCDDDDESRSPLLAETAYNGIDDDCDPMTPDDDLDGDGHPLATDCDDDAILVHPGQLEIPYNGIDDDCDPMTPDDDLDADGAPLATDCDDDDPTRSPLFGETPYNGIDDDCEAGTPDDDLDGDGHGIATDCDDEDPAIRPGAAEIYYNGIDDDCDPLTVDDDADADGYAVSIDCADMDPDINPGAMEVCGDGVDNDCDPEALSCGLAGPHSLVAAHATFEGALADDDAGQRVDSSGDVNCDGYDDVLISAPWEGVGGRVYLFYGGDDASRPLGSLLLSAADAIFETSANRAALGGDIDIAGDLDGDGCDEIILGSLRLEVAAGFHGGAAYLFYGGQGTDLLAGTFPVTSADATFTTDLASQFLGSAVEGAGDVNGDGFGDLLISASHASSLFDESGEVYLFYGGDGMDRLTGDIPAVASADARFSGSSIWDYSGQALAAAGDVDGDGFDDFLVGDHVTDRVGGLGGAAYLIYGGGGASAPTGLTTLAASDAIFEPAEVTPQDGLGFSIAGVGDVDGDGLDDFIIGARMPHPVPIALNEGAAYLYYGRPTANRIRGVHNVSGADLRIDSNGNHERTGFSVSGGDLNGDGFSDLLVGSSYYSGGSAPYTGAAHLYYGAPTRRIGALTLAGADAAFIGVADLDYAAESVCLAGDVNDDGYADILIGARDAFGAGADTGAAYLFYGQGI